MLEHVELEHQCFFLPVKKKSPPVKIFSFTPVKTWSSPWKNLWNYPWKIIYTREKYCKVTPVKNCFYPWKITAKSNPWKKPKNVKNTSFHHCKWWYARQINDIKQFKKSNSGAPSQVFCNGKMSKCRMIFIFFEKFSLET